MDKPITIEFSPTSAQVRERIAGERQRLLTEQNLEANLEGQRIAPLEAGDDAALDRVERQLAECLARQARIQERIEILAKRLTETEDAERSAELDAIEARATTMRETGERLIRVEYPKLAKALAIVLRRLATVDAAIERDNRELERGGRPPVANSNQIRCRPGQTVAWREKRTVGICEPEHPHYGKDISRSNQGDVAYLAGGGQCPAFMEVEVDRQEHISGDWQQPLYEQVYLPRADATALRHKSLPNVEVPPHFFERDHHEVSAAEIDGLIAELSEPRATSKKADK